MKHLKFAWLLLVLLTLAACGRDVAPDALEVKDAAVPTIASDKEDYAPGELVTLTGSNWQPGESVHINVDDDQTKTWERNVNVTADENGDIVDKFNLPPHFVATYQVVATGPDSGVAKASFTDGNVTYTPGRAPASGHQSVQAGSSWDFTITLDKQGGGSDPTVNTPFVVTNPTATCGKAETAIPASWLSVVSPALPKAIGSATLFTFRVSPVANASGTYTGRVNLTTTDGGSQTFDLCLNVTAANNPAPTLTSVSPASATQGNRLDVELTGTNFGSFSSVSFGSNITVNSTAVNSTKDKITANITVGAGAATGARDVSVTNAGPGGGTATLKDSFKVNAACTVPSITSQPAGATKTVGESVTFSVAASGTSLSYQWSKGSNDINGATSASYTISSVATSDAGDYTVVVTACGSSITSNKATLTVNKAQATISLGNLTGHTYDGNAKAATATTDPAGLKDVTISYSQNGKAVSEPTDAGEYAVVAKLDNPSYSAKDATGTLVIGKANQTVSFATGTPTTKKYGDGNFDVSAMATSKLAVSFAAKDNSTCSVSDTGTVSNLRVGDCVIVASQGGNGNYNAASAVEHKIVVSKTSAEISLEGLNHTYDGSAKKVTVTTKPSDLSVTVTYNGSEDAPTNAGSYDVVATVNDKNYEASQASNLLVIAQAAAAVEVSGYTGSYDGEAHGATGSAKGVKNEDLSSLLSLGDKFTDVPGGKAKWSFKGNTNYKAANGEVDIVIEKAKATINLTGGNYTYDGSAKSATATTDPSGLNGLTLTYGNSTTAPTNAGDYEVTASLNNSNYEAEVAKAALKIARAEAKIDVKGYEGVYDGKEHGATGTAIGVKGESLPLNLGDSFTNVPGGKASWSFGGGDNYEAASGSVDIKISKATATVNVSGYTGSYDGKAHGATGSAKGVKNEDLSSLLSLGDQFTNAGNYTASWSFAGGNNYDQANGSVDIKIAQAAATIKVEGYEGTYDGNAHGATGSVKGVKGEDLGSLLSLGNTFTNVPGGTVNWSFAGDTNYKAANDSVSIVISKANPTIDVKGKTVPYDGNAHGATGSATGVNGENLNGLSLGSSFTDAPGGTANWSFDDATGNYNNLSGSVQIVINKADQAALRVTGAPASALFNTTFTVGATGGTTGALRFAATGGACKVDATLVTMTSGTGTCSITATRAGGTNYNDVTSTVSVTPLPYTRSSVLQPINSDGSSVFKLGSTVPVKFQLTGASAGITNANATLKWVRTSGASGVAVNEPVSSNPASPGNTFRYEDGQYIFNLGTKNFSDGVWTLSIDLNDGTGSKEAARFTLRK